MLNLVAEKNALEDTISLLYKSFTMKIVTLDELMKHLKELHRREFEVKTELKKAIEVMTSR